MTGTGTLTGGAAVVTDAAGVATFGALSVNQVGSKTLTATSALLTATSSAFTVSPAAAASLAFTTQPSAVVAGVAIAPSVKVKASDAFGNAVPGASVALTMTGTGTLAGGAAVITDATGTATYASLSVNLVGSKALTATSALLTTTSSTFTVSTAAAATLAFTTQPSAVVAGVASAPAVKVTATDAFGNTVPGTSVALTMTGTGTLTGGAAVTTDTTGVATFPALSVNLVGSKSLTATSGLLDGDEHRVHRLACGRGLARVHDAALGRRRRRRDRACGEGHRDGRVRQRRPGRSIALDDDRHGTLTGGAAVVTDATGTATYRLAQREPRRQQDAHRHERSAHGHEHRVHRVARRGRVARVHDAALGGRRRCRDRAVGQGEGERRVRQRRAEHLGLAHDDGYGDAHGRPPRSRPTRRVSRRSVRSA
jgi:hypothetical protein